MLGSALWHVPTLVEGAEPLPFREVEDRGGVMIDESDHRWWWNALPVAFILFLFVVFIVYPPGVLFIGGGILGWVVGYWAGDRKGRSSSR